MDLILRAGLVIKWPFVFCNDLSYAYKTKKMELFVFIILALFVFVSSNHAIGELYKK